MTGAAIAALLAIGSRVRAMDLNPGEAILHDGDPQRCLVLLPGVRYFEPGAAAVVCPRGRRRRRAGRPSS